MKIRLAPDKDINTYKGEYYKMYSVEIINIAVPSVQHQEQQERKTSVLYRKINPILLQKLLGIIFAEITLLSICVSGEGTAALLGLPISAVLTMCREYIIGGMEKLWI